MQNLTFSGNDGNGFSNVALVSGSELKSAWIGDSERA